MQRDDRDQLKRMADLKNDEADREYADLLGDYGWNINRKIAGDAFSKWCKVRHCLAPRSEDSKYQLCTMHERQRRAQVQMKFDQIQGQRKRKRVRERLDLIRLKK